MKDLAVVRAVDNAEARGDATEALEMIETDLRTRRADRMFWHPDRLHSLLQLSLYGRFLPAWSRSRWILAQAARSLHEAQRAPARRAFDLAEDVAGPASRYGGVDELDAGSLLMDHDWVYRQVLLYEEHALERFLSAEASVELIGAADSIKDWVGVRMSALQFADESPKALSWLDLTTDEILQTPNIGSASGLRPGECVLGRVAPTTSGPLLDSLPLRVPRRVADEVAGAPADWPNAVRRGRERSSSEHVSISTAVDEFAIADDVPVAVRSAVLESAYTSTGRSAPSQPSVDDREVAIQALIKAALDGTIGDLDCPLSPWPTLGVVLLEPAGLGPVLRDWRHEDMPRYRALSRRISEPAASVCRMLGGASDQAA